MGRLLHNGLQVDCSVHKRHLTLVCSTISSTSALKCKHITLVQKYFPFAYENVELSSQVSQCTTLNVMI